MTIDELFRRILRGHWVAIALCVLLPVAATTILAVRAPDMWHGAVRIQVSDDPSGSSNETVAMSARVLALATTPSLVAQSLDDIGVRRDAAAVAEHHVNAQQLGVSSVVEISVTDHDRAVAGRLASALATNVASFINRGSRKHFDKVVADLTNQIQSADRQRSKLAAAQQVTGRATSYQAQLAIRTLTQQINDLRQERTALAVADASRDRAVVVDTGLPEVTRAPSGLAARIALATLLGLMLGLAAAAALEVMRPKIGNARELARVLDAPLLHKGSGEPAELAESLAWVARRQGVDTVVLVPADQRKTWTALSLLSRLRSLQPQAPDRSPKSVPASAKGSKTAVLFDSNYNGELDELSDFGTVQFTELSDLRPTDEVAAGLVVVSAGSMPRRGLEHLDDIVKAGRWPVLGVFDGSSLPRELPREES
ncbi:MAG TPA: hypothetical protein VFJ19_21100 [Nocardioidaceae bacterium]|nr:hypothetical protein [Nocardioidaceae bacterium]